MSFYLIFLYQECQSAQKCEKSGFWIFKIRISVVEKSWQIFCTRQDTKCSFEKSRQSWRAKKRFCAQWTSLLRKRTFLYENNFPAGTKHQTTSNLNSHWFTPTVDGLKSRRVLYESLRFQRRVLYEALRFQIHFPALFDQAQDFLNRSIGKNPWYKIREMSGFENETIK